MKIYIKNKIISSIIMAIITILLIKNYVENPENIFILPFIFICAVATIVMFLSKRSNKKEVNLLYKIYNWSFLIFASIFLIIMDVYSIITKNYIALIFSILFWLAIIKEVKQIIKEEKKEKNKFRF